MKRGNKRENIKNWIIFLWSNVPECVSVQQTKQKYLNETWNMVYYYVRNATTTFYFKKYMYL